MNPGTPELPWQCLREGQHSRSSPASPHLEGDATTRAERAICCRHCGSPVTDREAATEVAGQHLHTFFNPAGILFEIRCFERASGCEVHGERTTEFTWFPGFAWNYAGCGRCSAHLGWHFVGPDRSFFGLIRDKLVDP